MNIIKNPVLNIISASNELIVSLEAAKNFLKIDYEDDDEFIAKLIKTATNQCETYINKTLFEKNYLYSLYEIKYNSVFLPKSPVKSIETIELVAQNQEKIVLAVENYYLDEIAGVLIFKNMPTNFYRIDIKYVAGTSLIDEELIQGILMHVARMYEDRSGYSPIPLGSLNIYKKYREVRL